jgi:hypothetical protein
VRMPVRRMIGGRRQEMIEFTLELKHGACFTRS